MASAIRWLDQSASEQKRIQELVKLFQEHESRAELGIGQIRDVFSNVLFPGTSVLQTRARYFLVVPWLFKSAPSNLRGTELWGWVDRRERRLIGTLKDGGIVDGLIGRRAGPGVKLLASSIYWNGLKTWQIVFGDPDIDQLVGRAAPELDGVDELAGRITGDWTPDLPDAPEQLPATLPGGFELTADEAEWLREQVIKSVPESLLAHLVSVDVPLVPNTTGPWEEPSAISTPEPELQRWLSDAELFSFCMDGAGRLYNLLLIRAYRDAGFDAVATPEETYGLDVEDWQELADERRAELQAWDRPALRLRVAEQNPRISPATWAFVDAWIQQALTASDLADSSVARSLVADRERVLKGRQARLRNERLLQAWQGAAMRPLAYRWPNVWQIVTDIQRGRGVLDAAA